MSWVDQVRILAFQDVTADKPSFEYFLRRVFRWYGTTFSVDPDLVEAKPLYDVLRHYFEAHVEELDEKGRMEELLLLLEDDSPQAKKLKDDAETERFLAETAAESARQGPLKPKAAPVNNDRILPASKEPPPAPISEMPEVNLSFGDLLAADALAEDGVRGDPGFQIESPSPRRPKLRKGPPEGR